MFDLSISAEFELQGFDDLPQEQRPVILFKPCEAGQVEHLAQREDAITAAARAKMAELAKDFKPLPSITVTGNAEPGDRVKLAIGDRVHEVVADASGIWTINIQALERDLNFVDNTHNLQHFELILETCLKHVTGVRNFTFEGKPIDWDTLPDKDSEGAKLSKLRVLRNLGRGNLANANVHKLYSRIINGLDDAGKPGFASSSKTSGSSDEGTTP